MSKRVGLLLAGAFAFFYVLNYLMPLAFGDDCLYAFIWQGQPMFVPLTEDAVKITSLQDLVTSQISFYLTWSGRVINNTLSQLFVWAGKDKFNFFNTFACVLLVLEMYWCANKGKITFKLNISRLALLFMFLWIFSPGFPSVFFWLVGACHYLWPTVLVTGFLIPYIEKYYCFENTIADNCWFILFVFIFGIMASCTNENSVCWIILLLLIFINSNKNSPAMEGWMYAGFCGLVLGYAVLMFSPGNIVRLQATHDVGWFGIEKILENLHVLAIVFLFQFLLWYFCLRSLRKLFKVLHVLTLTEAEKKELHKELVLIKAFSVSAMGMSLVMLFSPEFYLRSAFFGTVQLIIVAGIIIRIQQDYGILLLSQNVKKILTCVGIVYFVVSAGFTLQHLYSHRVYYEKVLEHIAEIKKNGKATQIVLQVEPSPVISKAVDILSGYHTFDMKLSEDEYAWMNVAFARYYGIKGVRVLDTKTQSIVPKNLINNFKKIQ